MTGCLVSLSESLSVELLLELLPTSSVGITVSVVLFNSSSSSLSEERDSVSTFGLSNC